MNTLPSDVWTEILSYCDNSIERRLAEMDLKELKEVQEKGKNEIAFRLSAIKDSVKVNDIISIDLYSTNMKRIGMVLSKAVGKINPNSLKVLLLTETTKNTPFGPYKVLINVDYSCYCLLRLGSADVKVITKATDTIRANRIIARELSVNDVCEICPRLFTFCCRFECRFYAVVVKKETFAHIYVQEFDITYDTSLDTYSINFERIKKINTKDVLKKISLDDIEDSEDVKLNFLKGAVRDKIIHKNKLYNVFKSLNESA